MNTITFGIILLIYFLLVSYLGFIGYKGSKSSQDYLIGGREIHPVIMALSYGATFISTSAIIGFGGVAGLFGMSLLWLTFLNIFVGIFIAFVFFGKRTRQLSHKMEAHTFPEFISKRYGSPMIQKIGGLVIFIAMPLYAAVVLIGGARFMEEVLNLDYNMSMVIFSFVIAAYVIAGGIKGVMYTDAMQGLIMFCSLLFLLIVTYSTLGGVSSAHQALTNMNDLVPANLQSIGHQGWTSMPEFNSPFWWTLVSTLVLGVGIGVLAQPQLVVRFMMVKSNRELNRATLVGGIFVLVATGVIFMVGALSNVYFFQETGKLAIEVVNGNPDKIIPAYISAAMPEWFVYIFLLTLLSAAMSTLSSQFHAMGTSIGHDVYGQLVKNYKHPILTTRIAIIVSIVIAVIIGFMLPPGIIARGTALFFGICAATFLPAYFGGLYWKNATSKGALWSIIIGFGTSLFCLLFLHQKESQAIGLSQYLFDRPVLIETFPWPVVDPILIALPVSIIVFVVVSKLTSVTNKTDVEEMFNSLREKK